jgi:hypothetical protein
MSERRFKTDYAGAWCGHCATRESAIIAAIKHVVSDGYTRATITDKLTHQDIARVHLSVDRKRAVIETVMQLRRVPR